MKRKNMKLYSILSKNKKLISLVSIITVLMNLFFIFYMDSIKNLINLMVSTSFNQSFRWIIIIGIVLIVDMVLNYLLSISKKKLYCNLITDLRMKFFKKINNISLPKLDQYLNADLTTRFVDDLKSIANFVSDDLVEFISNILFFIFMFIYLTFNEWRLIPIVIILLPINSYIMKKYGTLLEKQSTIVQQEISTLNVDSQDIFSNVNSIKSFLAEKFFIEKYCNKERQVVNSQIKQTIYKTITWSLGIINFNSILIFFYIIGGFLVIGGNMDYGLIIGLYLSLDKIIRFLTNVPSMLSSIFEIKTKLTRVNEILSLEDTTANEEQGIGYINNTIENIIEMKNVGYSYCNDTTVLNNVSLEIKKGEKIAIVGESGCGKSTLLKLLIGYDNNYKGTIKLFGKDLSEINVKKLREYISFCQQETFLMNKTILENFSMIYDNIDEKILSQYAKLAEIEEEINEFKNKYETLILEDGKNLSGGQKQRLGLMLALMKSSELYMIDEGFSAIDPITSDKIIKNIFQQISNTIIVVTHRLYENLMNKFDKIIVMQNGKIVGIGSHMELMSNSVYKEIYEKSQKEMVTR